MRQNIRPVTLLLLVLLLSIFYSLPAVAQVASSDDIYRASRDRFSLELSALLQNFQDDLGIDISYDRQVIPYLEQKVPMAPWKYWNDPKLRLAYMLAPLDLSFEEEGNGYRIVVPSYYMRPEEEGRLHLERLIKRFSDQESWAVRREALRQAIRETMGLTNLPTKQAFHTIDGELLTGDGFTAQAIALEILQGYYVCGTLYRPLETTVPTPLVLFAHGHDHQGRFASSQQIGSATLTRMGATVFAWSMFAWIEQETPSLNYSKHKDHRTEISGPLQTLATRRIIDWLSTLDGVDSSRIAMTGASGGGTQTFLATAIDDRITVTVSVVMVSAHFFGGCPCESSLPFHLLCGGTNNVEIAACAAPRPMLLIGVTQDWTKNLPEVEFPYLQKIYSYFGKPENVEYAYFDEPHDYSFAMRSAMYPFMAKHLGLDGSKADESKIDLLPTEKLLPFGPNGENYPQNGIKTLQDVRDAFDQRQSF